MSLLRTTTCDALIVISGIYHLVTYACSKLPPRHQPVERIYRPVTYPGWEEPEVHVAVGCLVDSEESGVADLLYPGDVPHTAGGLG